MCIPLVVLAVSVELERAIKIMHALRGLDSSNAHTHTHCSRYNIHSTTGENRFYDFTRRTKKKTG